MLFPSFSLQTPIFGLFFFGRSREEEWWKTGLGGTAFFIGWFKVRKVFEKAVLG
jgi:hypothetical protein